VCVTSTKDQNDVSVQCLVISDVQTSDAGLYTVKLATDHRQPQQQQQRLVESSTALLTVVDDQQTTPSMYYTSSCSLRRQESGAIAKMTGRCALYVSALKVFETP